MKIVVTGAAGFIGSHLCRHLARQGNDVMGVDSLTDYYDEALKRRNIEFSRHDSSWEFVERPVGSLDASDLAGVDAIVHLAAQPGVRLSWSAFDQYLHHNVRDTNSLAAAAVEAGVGRFAFASSSSVYGDAAGYPTSETDPTRPRSPYGVTKLAGEALLEAYTMASPIEVVAMRFFTVYGPGQRPDMATQRLIRAALDGTTFRLFGDGSQRRDFTFVADVVRACASAVSADLPHQMHRVNVGGSGDTSMLDLIALVEHAAGRPIRIERLPEQRGDVLRTGADPALALSLLGWSTQATVHDGVPQQVAFELAPSPATWAVT